MVEAVPGAAMALVASGGHNPSIGTYTRSKLSWDLTDGGGRRALVFPAVVGGPGERVAVGEVVGRRRCRLCPRRGRASSPTSRSWPSFVCVGARVCGLRVGGRVCPVLRAPAVGCGCPTHGRWWSMWVG